MGLRWTTRRTIHQLVKERKPFLLGNIRAEVVNQDDLPRSFGRLSINNMNQLKSDIAGQTTTYVVYSYQTPIAWTNKTDWFIPADSYSVTTNHHQSVISVAIGTNCYQ